jgi:alpha-ketoglutarate-dependent taurine dioxygenase
MSFEVRPLIPALGAEIRGLDLREPLDGETVASLAAAWHRYGVLLFRDQQISAEDQKRFTRYFGEFQRPRGGPRKNEDVLFIGNTEVDGIPADIPLGAMQLHQDGAYGERPTKSSLLFALELPAQGGDTLWASLANAYDTLPADVQTRILPLDIRFNFDSATTMRDLSIWRKDIPDYTHPLVIAHPDTGRPLLFCNRLMADAIVGLPQTESDELIAVLNAHIERPDNVYRHVWRRGDFAIWDNLATAHGRTDFDPAQTRLLRRTTILGGRPVAYRDTLATAR